MLNQTKEETLNSIDSSDEAEMESDDGNEPNTQNEAVAGPSGISSKPVKKKKRGIIYVSTIPKHMTVAILREMLGQYAKVGRIFLQPGKTTDDDKKGKKKRRRMTREFTEGWVEFESKRAAKQIASSLNTKPMATRKSSKFYDILWSMKYLPRFKWTHLSERLTYERAVQRQKLQTEISQARKEAAFFQDNLDKSKKFKKMKKKGTKLSKEME